MSNAPSIYFASCLIPTAFAIASSLASSLPKTELAAATINWLVLAIVRNPFSYPRAILAKGSASATSTSNTGSPRPITLSSPLLGIIGAVLRSCRLVVPDIRLFCISKARAASFAAVGSLT